MPNTVPYIGQLVTANASSPSHGVVAGETYEVISTDREGRMLIHNPSCTSSHSECARGRLSGLHGCGWWVVGMTIKLAEYGPKCNHICYPHCACEAHNAQNNL